MPSVEVKNLAKVINEKIIVDRVSFSVNEGEIFGLLGSNGSGKTTTFNMMSGLMKASSGTVKILGKDIQKSREFRRNIGLITQQDSFYETLTVRENLEFFASQYGFGRNEIKEKTKNIVEHIKLTPQSETLASKLSGGMKKRLNMGCSLVHDPKIIFLDEPTVGLDPLVRREIWKLIKELNGQKKTIIIGDTGESIIN